MSLGAPLSSHLVAHLETDFRDFIVHRKRQLTSGLDDGHVRAKLMKSQDRWVGTQATVKGIMMKILFIELNQTEQQEESALKLKFLKDLLYAQEDSAATLSQQEFVEIEEEAIIMKDYIQKHQVYLTLTEYWASAKSLLDQNIFDGSDEDLFEVLYENISSKIHLIAKQKRKKLAELSRPPVPVKREPLPPPKVPRYCGSMPPQPPVKMKPELIDFSDDSSLNSVSDAAATAVVPNEIADRMAKSLVWRLSTPSQSGRKYFSAQESEAMAAKYCQLINKSCTYKELLKLYFAEKDKNDPDMLRMKEIVFKKVWKADDKSVFTETELSRIAELVVWFFGSARHVSLSKL